MLLLILNYYQTTRTISTNVPSFPYPTSYLQPVHLGQPLFHQRGGIKLLLGFYHATGQAPSVFFFSCGGLLLAELEYINLPICLCSDHFGSSAYGRCIYVAVTVSGLQYYKMNRR